MKRITITWYIKPEDMRILVLPLKLVKLGIFLFAFGLLIPGGGLAWLIFVTPESTIADQRIPDHHSPALGNLQAKIPPKSFVTVASSDVRVSSGASSAEQGRVVRRDVEQARSRALPISAEMDLDRENEAEPGLQEDEGDESRDESRTDSIEISRPSPGVSSSPTQKRSIDFSGFGSEFDEGGNLTIKVNIRNQGRVEAIGSVWAVAVFVSLDGSRILVPSHALIQAENVASVQNRQYGLPYKARSLTVKTFHFELPTDIDGSFKQVTVVASPGGIPVDSTQEQSNQAPANLPLVRTYKVEER